MFLVFIGPPGTGKGTQSKRLLEYLRIPHFSMGEMLRGAKDENSDLGKLVAQHMDGGRLVPDEVVMRIVLERLSQPEFAAGCLFDGFPRTLFQAQLLDQALQDRGTPLDAVIELQGLEKELISRLQKRAIVEQRADDTPEVIAQRMKVYKCQTAPLLGYYERQGLLHSINAMGSPDEVFSQIKASLCTQ